MPDAGHLVAQDQPELVGLVLRDFLATSAQTWAQARSKRSASMTLTHAATKSLTNFCFASSLA